MNRYTVRGTARLLQALRGITVDQFIYSNSALTGFIGDRRRWRTMPWMVLLFGVMIIPSGAVSIVLVVLQPIGVGSWCTLCLATAAIMLLMVSPALRMAVFPPLPSCSWWRAVR